LREEEEKKKKIIRIKNLAQDIAIRIKKIRKKEK